MTHGQGHNSAAFGQELNPRSHTWFAISRDLENHPIVGFGQPVKPANPKRGSYSRGEAWLSLLAMAQYKSTKVKNKGRTVLLERGQLMGALSYLAERWNWTVETVRWFLKRLEEESMAKSVEPTYETHGDHPKPKHKKRHNLARVLSICNYDIYQTSMELSDRLNATQNPKPTPSQPQESNKETKITNTTQLTRAQLDRLETKLFEAANGAMANPAVAPGVLALTEPIRWLNSGCDLDLDILPTIRKRAHSVRPGSVKSWGYFTNAVADAKAAREAPMPTGQAPPPQKPRNFHEEQDYLRQVLNKSRQAHG